MDAEGVFNFTEHFPGSHMIRARLSNWEAWNLLSTLASKLRESHSREETIDFAWFGTLYRDAEEDKGSPIEFESPVR